MDIRKIQKIAANEYNCCKTENCDCKCEQCPYNISDEDEEEFFYTIWQVFSDKRRKVLW